ncbi:hypothetical protein ACVXZ4_01110 [Lacisediminihabitans sp. FW035]
MLVVSVGILLVAAVALCWYNAGSPQSYRSTDSGIPWPVVWAQVASSAASAFALVGLAAGAGLLFLRAFRWTAGPEGDEDPTPEPSP